MAERDDLFSGMQRQRSPRQHTLFTPNSDLVGGDRISIAGQAGHGFESMATALWGGVSIEAATRFEAARLMANLQREILTSPDNTVPNIYQRLGYPIGNQGMERPKTRPSDKRLHQLVQILDELAGSPTIGPIFDFLDNSKPPYMTDPRVRYIIGAALAGAHEVVNPSFQFKEGHLHPNVNFVYKNFRAQFDGVITSSAAYSPITDAFSLQRYFLAPGDPSWSIIQIKLVTDDRYATENHLTRIIPRHERELRNQLACLALLLKQKDEGFFMFPDNVYFAYARPSIPTVIHQLKIDMDYLRRWALQIDFRIAALRKAKLPENDELVSELATLQLALEEDANVREITENRPTMAQIEETVKDWREKSPLLKQVPLDSLDQVPQVEKSTGSRRRSGRIYQSSTVKPSQPRLGLP